MSTRARSRSRSSRARVALLAESTFLNCPASKEATKAEVASRSPRKRRISVGSHVRPISRSRSRSRPPSIRMCRGPPPRERNSARSILPWTVLVLLFAFFLNAIIDLKKSYESPSDDAALRSVELAITDPFGVGQDHALAQAVNAFGMEKSKIREAQDAFRSVSDKFNLNSDLCKEKEGVPELQELDFSSTTALGEDLGHTLYDVMQAMEVLSFDAGQLEAHDPATEHREGTASIIERTRTAVQEIQDYNPAQRTWAGIEFAYLPRQFYEPTADSSGGPVAGLWFSRWERFLSQRQQEANTTAQQARQISDALTQFDEDFIRYNRESSDAQKTLDTACEKANAYKKSSFFHHKMDVDEYIRMTPEQQVERSKEQEQVRLVSAALKSALLRVEEAYKGAASHSAGLREQIPMLQASMLTDGKSAALEKFQELLEEFLKTV